MREDKEDIYVRLEAGAALMVRGNDAGAAFFDKVLSGLHDSYRLEATIVLAEVATAESARLLRRTLADANVHSLIRGAAAWAIGEIGMNDQNIAALIGAFQALDTDIRKEAARALTKLGQTFRAAIVASFPHADQPTQRPGIAWALSRSAVRIEELLPHLVDDNARHWVAYMIGRQNREAMAADIDALRASDPELYFAVSVLWTILESWIDDFDE